MAFKKKVEVTNMTRATENATGDSIFMVQFGEEVLIDEEIKKTLPAPTGSKFAKKLYSNVFVAYFSGFKVAPYKVGSKWEVEIKENGEILIKSASE